MLHARTFKTRYRWTATRTAFGLLSFGASLGAGPRAAAQAPPPAPSTSPGAPGGQANAPPERVQAPRLLEGAEATYPEDAAARRIEATVVLRLTVGADGTVKDAEVVASAGGGFDEAARVAALRLRFAPATRDGRPVTSRILFPYDFRLPSEPAPPLAPARAAPAPPSPAPATSPSTSTGPSVIRPRQVPVEVTVRGRPTEAQRLLQSAEAVAVVDTRRAQTQSSDLGEVMARAQGVSVRRSGGLGSVGRVSLNGLQDDQIRFFLDGVPLELAGYPFGVANVPVNLVERVEIYRGVVPARFGADALGGAVHLVSDAPDETRLSASYQVGSFGTRRVTAAGRYHHDPTGFVAGGSAFFDVARNDYLVDDRKIVDDLGRIRLEAVRRFHDGYRAYGGSVEAGVVDRPWAKRLLLRGFASTYDKELQHNPVMEVPYGEVTYGETVAGATLRYEQPILPSLDLDLVGSYAHRTIYLADKGEWVYDWLGRRTTRRDPPGDELPGEIDGRAHDRTQWQKSGLARATLTLRLAPGHALRLSVAPTFTKRTGDERAQTAPGERDPLTARQELFTLVGGIEHEANTWAMAGAPTGEEHDAARDDRVQNILFAKAYFMRSSSEAVLPGGVFRPLTRDTFHVGVGDSLRFRLFDWLDAKASYELATRLPSPDEIFGDGLLIAPNVELDPETSHNINLGPRLELRRTAVGDISAELNGFLRESEDLIFRVFLHSQGELYSFQFDNVARARALGVESQLGWVSPGRWVSLDGGVTLQDVRNASSAGRFGDFEGDRMPNRPWLFASWGARSRVPRLLTRGDELEPFYVGRYVHEFFRAWESRGVKESKDLVPSQLTHGIGVTYSMRTGFARFSTTIEVQNLTDERVYDFFGVQRPGRTLSLKVTGEM
ncbi:TonB-dependent siderophore myxochelin receptor MxcH [Sorangium sp. So ce1099]|uniref:TonB-dependent siderophore myxochelin receptor MxcH n=1 Tax=Sorangium sp. So ce1099 TaxID=3133331 RepID=UPI003F6455C2